MNVTGPLSYRVELLSGQVVHQHVDAICPCKTLIRKPEVRPSDIGFMANDVFLPDVPVNPTPLPVGDADVADRVALQPHTTLRRERVHPKDPKPSLTNLNLAYCIPCVMCPAVYVGHTLRSLGTCLNKHKDAVNHVKTDVSAIAEHV